MTHRDADSSFPLQTQQTSRKNDESSLEKTAHLTRYFLLLIDQKYDLRGESISDKWRATYHQVDSLNELWKSQLKITERLVESEEIGLIS